jgi:hypothetical protein
MKPVPSRVHTLQGQLYEASIIEGTLFVRVVKKASTCQG